MKIAELNIVLVRKLVKNAFKSLGSVRKVIHLSYTDKRINLFFIAFLASCQFTGLLHAEGINRTNPDFLKEYPEYYKINPHNKADLCKVCHMADDVTLRDTKSQVKNSIKRKEMKTDLIDLCRKCHSGELGFLHPVGIKTKLNRRNLPLESNGNVNCATTCHDVHAKEEKQAGKMLRLPFDDLCLSCHEG